MEKLTIRAFKAVEDPGSCDTFLEKHRAVLEAFGITNVSTNNDRWCADPGTYVIVAESDQYGMVGGIRIETNWGKSELPICEALRSFDGRIDAQISSLAEFGTGEVCGLWNALSHNAMGLPQLLSFAAVSIANQIGLRSLTCLVAHYTLRHALRVGFSVMEGVGEGGTFTYPIPSIKAIAMVIPDVISLDAATQANRRNLLSLRLRPGQTKVEVVNNKAFEVRYDLLVDPKVFKLVPYRIIEEERLRHSA